MITKHIELQFRHSDGLYIVRSIRSEIYISHCDRDEVGKATVRLIKELIRKGITCRIEAYDSLGPFLKQFRDVGAICRTGLVDQELPPVAKRRITWQMPDTPVPDPPPPVFASWADYLNRTPYNERMVRCYAAAKKANRKRLLSDAPEYHLTGKDVWTVIEAAKGRCAYCGSLAIENRPSHPKTGAPLPWAQVGRRIGSLEHINWRFGGGDNKLTNLAWACLWCNTWESERRKNASDHGGFYPTDKQT